jgi:hypothetical protein
MAPQPADRSRYEAEQAAFVRSLIRGDGFPEGLDEDKAAAASRSLWRKRLRAVEAAWPALAVSLGDAFAGRFEAYARAVAPPAVGDGATDGLRFARTLQRDELTGDARVELLLARAGIASGRGGSFRDRRGCFAGAVSVREPRRIVVVVRAPLAGRRVFVVPLGRER